MTGDRAAVVMGALAVIAGVLFYAIGHQQAGCLIGYPGLAVVCAGYAWRSPTMCGVGLALLIGNALSIVGFYTMSVAERPQALTVVEIIITASAYLSRMGGGPRGLIVIVAISMLSCAANVFFSMQVNAPHSLIRFYSLFTNLCYVGECLALIISLRLERSVRSDHNHHRVSHRRRGFALDAHDGGQETNR